jgi:hypothetical protein
VKGRPASAFPIAGDGCTQFLARRHGSSIDLQLRDLARVAQNMFEGVGNNVLGRAANSGHEQFEQRLITGTPAEDAKHEGAPPGGTAKYQPPSSSFGSFTANPLLTISAFSQKANLLVLAPASAAPGASCSASFTFPVALADASKSVGALNWNSFNVSSKTSAVGHTWWTRPLTGVLNANNRLAHSHFWFVQHRAHYGRKTGLSANMAGLAEPDPERRPLNS